MLPKHKYLLTYRYSEVVHDLTVEFCEGHITDFEDYLRQHHLEIWSKTDKKIQEYRNWGIETTRFESPKSLMLPKLPIEAANLLLTLSHQLTFLLDRQIKAMIQKFEKEGGFTENLLKGRLKNKLPK